MIEKLALIGPLASLVSRLYQLAYSFARCLTSDERRMLQGKFKKLISSLQFGADAVALRRDGTRVESGKMESATSMKPFGYTKNGHMFDFFSWRLSESHFPAEAHHCWSLKCLHTHAHTHKYTHTDM